MLQKVSHEIEYRESEDCLKFLKFDRHHSRSMTKLKHGYAIGKVTISVLNADELNAVRQFDSAECTIQQKVHKFNRLFVNDIILHMKVKIKIANAKAFAAASRV